MTLLGRRDGLPALVLCTLITAACVSVDPEPFEDFREATDQVRAGTNAILLLDYEWSRRGFVETVLGSAPEELGTLFLTFDEDAPFDVQLHDPPVFLVVNQARHLLTNLASTFAGYAQLLARLAGPEVIRPKTLDTLERDLDARLREATKALEEEPHVRLFELCGEVVVLASSRPRAQKPTRAGRPFRSRTPPPARRERAPRFRRPARAAST